MLKSHVVLGRGVPAALALALATFAGGAGATFDVMQYSGRATVLNAAANATTLSARVVLGDTGELDPWGATRETTAVDVRNPPPTEVSAQSITAITAGVNEVSASSAAVQRLRFKRGTLAISADVIDASSTATCDRATQTVRTAGASSIANLRVNNLAIPVTGKANQKVAIPGVATIIINEQSNPDVNTIEVTAVHVIVPGVTGVAGADVKISYARSGILTCPPL